MPLAKLNDLFPREHVPSSPMKYPIRFKARTLTILPCCGWDYYYQRPQAFVQGLARLLPTWDFFFVSTSIHKMPITQVEKNLFLVNIPWFHQYKHLLSKGVYYTTYPLHMKLFLGEAKCIWWDCVDHPLVYRIEDMTMVNQILEIIKTKPSVLTSINESLITDILKQPAHIVKNATWPAHFQLSPLPPETKPVIGFWGFVGPWVDDNLVRNLAKHFPVKIASDNSQALAPAQTIGYLNYKQLKEFAKDCTHLIIPFKLNDQIAKYSDPLKYYEYLYTNRVIIRPNNVEQIYGSQNEIVYDGDFDKLIAAIKTPHTIIPFEDLYIHSWENRCIELASKVFGDYVPQQVNRVILN